MRLVRDRYEKQLPSSQRYVCLKCLILLLPCLISCLEISHAFDTLSSKMADLDHNIEILANIRTPMSQLMVLMIILMFSSILQREENDLYYSFPCHTLVLLHIPPRHHPEPLNQSLQKRCYSHVVCPRQSREICSRRYAAYNMRRKAMFSMYPKSGA